MDLFKQRQQRAPNQPPSKLQLAQQRTSPYNQSIPGNSGLIRNLSQGRSGSTATPTAGLPSQDARILERQQREARIAARLNDPARIAAQRQANQPAIEENMLLVDPNNPLGAYKNPNIYGLHGRREDGSVGSVSQFQKNRERMSAGQRAKNDAMLARKDQRRQDFMLARAAKNQRQNAQPGILDSPVFSQLARQNPQAALELAAQMQQAQAQNALQREQLAQAQKNTLFDQGLRNKQLESESALTGAKVAALNASRSSEQQRRDMLTANLPTLIAQNPQLAQQLGAEAVSMMGVQGTAVPSTVPSTVLDESGLFSSENAEDIAKFYIYDQGLTGEPLRQALLGHMTDDQLRELAKDATPGPLEKAGAGFGMMLRSLIGDREGMQSDFDRKKKLWSNLRESAKLPKYRSFGTSTGVGQAISSAL